MAAVAVAKLDVLSSHIKRERLRPDVKSVRRIQSRNEEQKRGAYLKTVEDTKKKSLLLKNKVKQSIKEKQRARSEANKREALKSCLKTIGVAKYQLNEDLLLQLKKLYHLPLESYDSQSLEFLKVEADSETMDIWFLVEHLMKYEVVVMQMEKESEREKEYKESLINTRNQISQLLDILKLTAMLITGKIDSNSEYPLLPDELVTGTSKSGRQNRDYLFVKEYKNYLDIIESFLKNY